MARSPNCTGAPLFKGRVDVTITYPDPDETLLETPVALPTSEPAEAQISYTLGSQHMPVWSPFELEHKKLAILYAAGRNTGGSAATVYFRVLKNGVNVATGSQSVGAGYFYNQSHYRFFDVSSGDALSCKLWANAAGVNWDRAAVLVWPTRIGPKGQVLADAIAHEYGFPYNLTFSGARYGEYAYLYPFSNSETICAAWYSTGDKLPVVQSHATYGIARVGYGDKQLGSLPMAFSASTRAQCAFNQCFTRLSYTPLNLRV